jgi:hypothetical protein
LQYDFSPTISVKFGSQWRKILSFMNCCEAGDSEIELRQLFVSSGSSFLKNTGATAALSSFGSASSSAKL